MQQSPTRLPPTKDARLSLDNGVAVLLLDRDDVRNALTGTHLLDDIIRVCEWINRTPEVGALVISGMGKAFSAGGNIKDMQQKQGMFGGDGIQIQDSYRHGIQAMTTQVYRLEVPVIAAVNGAAVLLDDAERAASAGELLVDDGVDVVAKVFDRTDFYGFQVSNQLLLDGWPEAGGDVGPAGGRTLLPLEFERTT